MKKVLIIEDEEAIRAVIKAVLVRSKMEVTACDNLASGRSEFNNSYDLLVVDITLPDGSGADFVKEVRENGYQGKIFVMTGHSDVIVAEADHILFKPFSLKAFLELLK